MVRKTYFLVLNRAFIACIHSPTTGTRWQETKMSNFVKLLVTRARSGRLAAICHSTGRKKYLLALAILDVTDWHEVSAYGFMGV